MMPGTSWSVESGGSVLNSGFMILAALWVSLPGNFSLRQNSCAEGGIGVASGAIRSTRDPCRQLRSQFQERRDRSAREERSVNVCSSWVAGLGLGSLGVRSGCMQMVPAPRDRGNAPPTGLASPRSRSTPQAASSGHRVGKCPVCLIANSLAEKKVRLQGLEPWTYGLKVRCSTN